MPPFARRRPATAMLSLMVALLLTAAALPAAATAQTAGVAAEGAVERALQPVLGSANYALYGEGFGRAHPKKIFNGGAPSGIAKNLRWRHWGSARAIANGKTYLYRPDGGYYARSGRIQLRAQQLGYCPDGTYGYTYLMLRSAKRPGGPISKRWSRWSGDGNICN